MGHVYLDSLPPADLHPSTTAADLSRTPAPRGSRDLAPWRSILSIEHAFGTCEAGSACGVAGKGSPLSVAVGGESPVSPSSRIRAAAPTALEVRFIPSPIVCEGKVRSSSRRTARPR